MKDVVCVHIRNRTMKTFAIVLNRGEGMRERVQWGQN
jgi:hypothetical protein